MSVPVPVRSWWTWYLRHRSENESGEDPIVSPTPPDAPHDSGDIAPVNESFKDWIARTARKIEYGSNGSGR